MKQLYLTIKHFYYNPLFNKYSDTFKSYIFLLSILTIPFSSFAQLDRTWAKEYNQAATTLDMAISNDQNPVVLSGGTNLVGFQDHRITKYNAQGDQLWRNDLHHDEFTVRVDRAGNSYTLGNIVSKFSETGQLLWEYYLGQLNNKDKTIEVDVSGNIYVAGLNDASATIILKLNNTGQLEWQQTLATSEANIKGLILAIGDDLYLGGTGFDEKSNVTVFELIKLGSSTGDVLLHNTYNDPAFSPSNYSLKAMLWSDSGHLYMVGEDMATRVSHTSLKLLKATPDGERVWEAAELFEHKDFFADATLDAEGNILLLARSQLLPGPTGIVTAKYSSSGKLLWSDTYGTGNKHNATPAAIIALPDGSIAVTGSTITDEENTDLLVLIYNSDGSKDGTDIYGATGTSRDAGQALSADKRGNLYVGGFTQPRAQMQESNMLLLRYNIHDDCHELDLEASGGTLSCGSNTLELKAHSVAAGALYSWAGPNAFTSDEQNPKVNMPGIYIVTVQDPVTGCTASASVTVTAPEQSIACKTADLDAEEKGLLSSLNNPEGPVKVTGRKRNPDGSYAAGNYAAIFDSQAPTGDDADLYTRDWGNVLIVNQDQTEIPNDNQWGGELILNFSAFGPVTMESMRVLDIDAYENSSWVYLYDGEGNELHKLQLSNLGNNSKQTVDLGNTKNVMVMKVVFDGLSGDNLAGSGAIDNIKYCVKSSNDACKETDNIEAVATDNAIAYPTPFTDKTTIAFKTEKSETYVVLLYDPRGNLIRDLTNDVIRTGELNSVEVEGRNLLKGLYFARIISKSGIRTVKLIVKK